MLPVSGLMKIRSIVTLVRHFSALTTLFNLSANNTRGYLEFKTHRRRWDTKWLRSGAEKNTGV